MLNFIQQKFEVIIWHILGKHLQEDGKTQKALSKQVENDMSPQSETVPLTRSKTMTEATPMSPSEPQVIKYCTKFHRANGI